MEGDVCALRPEESVLAPDRIDNLRSRQKRFDGISYEHPTAFWFGVVITSLGVLLQLPAFYEARSMDYHLAGMPVTAEMVVGMVLLVIGVGATAYGHLAAKVARP